jgi:hypothetical protein
LTSIREGICHAVGSPENADHAALNVASTVRVRGLQARPANFDYTRATSSSKGPFGGTGGLIKYPKLPYSLIRP